MLEGIRVWLEQSRADIKVVDGLEKSKETDVSFMFVLIICTIYIKTKPCFCFHIQEGCFSIYIFVKR